MLAVSAPVLGTKLKKGGRRWRARMTRDDTQDGQRDPNVWRETMEATNLTPTCGGRQSTTLVWREAVYSTSLVVTRDVTQDGLPEDEVGDGQDGRARMKKRRRLTARR